MTYLDRSTTSVFSSREKVHQDKIVSIKQNAKGCVWFKQNAGESGWQLSMGMKVKNGGDLAYHFATTPMKIRDKIKLQPRKKAIS